MAITKILTINDCGRKFAGRHLQTAITYILDPSKTQNMRYVTGINCQPEKAFDQMLATKQKFGKTDKRQGYHIIISFEEEDVEPGTAFEIIRKFAEEYLGQGYEAIYAVHDNTAHTHGHIIFNSVNGITGRKYRYEKGDWAKVIQPITNRLCEEYGLATMEIEMAGQHKNEYYKDWNEFRDGKLIWRDMIRRDLDACILQSDDMEEFLDMLKEMGYEIKQNKYLAVKPPGMQRYCRCKSLGEEYTEDRIEQRIALEDLKSYANRSEKEFITVPEDEFLPRTKLTGIQKTYYAKVCRIRKLKRLPYSKAWQYKNEIRKLNECHEQYMFLVENEIHTLPELVAACSNLKEKEAESRRERRSLSKEEKRFSGLFQTAEEMEQLQPAYHSYLEGDEFFEKEYYDYESLKEKLKEQGYTKEQVDMIQNGIHNRIAENYEKRQAVYRRRVIAEKMITELTDRMEKQREQKMIENRERKTRQPKR